VVDLTIYWCRKLQCSEANVGKGFAIETESLIRVLYKLVNRESGVVRQRNRKLQKHAEVLGRQTSTTVSETAGLGTTEYMHIIRSGHSFLILDIKSVPITAPVTPSEWVMSKLHHLC
jgi:hypothetical protein